MTVNVYNDTGTGVIVAIGIKLTRFYSRQVDVCTNCHGSSDDVNRHYCLIAQASYITVDGSFDMGAITTTWRG